MFVSMNFNNNVEMTMTYARKQTIMMPNVTASGCGIMLLLLVLNTPGEPESEGRGAEVSSKF